MSELDQTRQVLHEGVNKIKDAMAPLQNGRTHAEWITTDVHQQRLATRGIIEFFSAMQNRINREVGVPYRAAQRGCVDGVRAIVGGLRGAENPLAVEAREETINLSDRALGLVEQMRQIKEGDVIDVVIGALETARAHMEKIATVMGGAEQAGNEILSESYPAVVDRVMRYSDVL